MDNKDKILTFLKKHSNVCDDCLSCKCEIYPRQQVNQITKRLSNDGKINKTNGRCTICSDNSNNKFCGRNKLVSSIKTTTAKNACINADRNCDIKPKDNESLKENSEKGSFMETEKKNGLTEDETKKLLENWLKEIGWKAKVAYGHERGADIIAKKNAEKWCIEVKGTASRPPMFNNYFLMVLGELLQRMEPNTTKYSIAFPEHNKFKNLWLKLPLEAKKRLKISALFVAENGDVEELP